MRFTKYIKLNKLVLSLHFCGKKKTCYPSNIISRYKTRDLDTKFNKINYLLSTKSI